MAKIVNIFLAQPKLSFGKTAGKDKICRKKKNPHFINV